MSVEVMCGTWPLEGTGDKSAFCFTTIWSVWLTRFLSEEYYGVHSLLHHKDKGERVRESLFVVVEDVGHS